MALTQVSSGLLATTGVTTGTYGGASTIPVVTVNAEGQVTSASNVTASIANTQITGLITSGQIATVANTQVTGTMNVIQGGTGLASLTSNNVVLGNGTNNVLLVAPGTTGNVLTSNNGTWNSQAPAPSFTTGKAIAMSLVFGF